MGLLDNFKKKRAIKSYIEKLPNVLVNDYGRQEYYTQLQVRRSIERAGLNSQYQHYALAMYTNHPEFVVYQSELHENFSYEKLREEVDGVYFSGSTEFNCSSVIAASASFGGDASSIDCSGGGGDGGGQ
ncbi:MULTISPECIES: DUF6559 family protein [Halomonadaceae]|uniref:Uncharacterized protein n=1 Tax=Vreelandella titanicae TaxID=664683 RepID=A0AAP9NID7_9GAMM|nr:MULTISPECIES: DUF6559 family protein [Halomonas]QKS22376.1 hypothetical protein FX987_00118 [Halomonas titanicae]CDG52015.1 hypothetical protein HALA3H3_30232 [Halomonas sp. A3H3]SDI01946.1 hypothetical protein SAMN04487867_101112 [Halomonas titanicae]